MHADRLNAPRKSRLVSASPVYYGWIILAVGSLGVIMTSPGQTYAISIFIEHFIADLGVSRSLISTLYTAATLSASLALMAVGRQVDRRGPRLTMAIITVLFGLTCIYMGAISNAVMLAVGFFALRLLGQGSLSLVSQNVINQWWVRRRGLAMGIAGMAWALMGQGLFPNLVNWLIPRSGWRATYIFLGAMLLVGMMPIGVIFVRDHPEDYGLQPDGDEPPDPRGAVGSKQIAEENWTLSETLHTSAFRIVAAGLFTMSMLSTGLTFHIVSIFADSGLNSTVAATVFLPIAATSAIVNLGSGVLADRVPVRVLLAVGLLLQAVNLVMAPYLLSVNLALAYGVIAGFKGGLQGIVTSVVWAKYFGRRHLGSITGVTTMLIVAGSALGPMPLGIARDLLGSYTITLLGAAILPLALSIATLIFGKPPKRPVPEVQRS